MFKDRKQGNADNFGAEKGEDERMLIPSIQITPHATV
jgi:hypothetical protein